MSTILFSGVVGPIPVSVIVKEEHNSGLEITELAIESGAKITDHAYAKPKRLTIEVCDAQAVATWNALVRFQESRVPFTMVSGLFVYKDMLIEDMTAERNSKYSKILKTLVTLKQVIIVETARTEGSNDSSGKDGGTKSTKSSSPSKGKASDAVTKDRASGPVNRGDVSSTTMGESQNRSLASRLFGSGPQGSSATP